MSWKWLAAVLAICVCMGRALGAGVFDVKGRPPASAVVTVGPGQPAEDPGSPMLDQLRGVLARIDRKECAALRAAGLGPLVEEPDDGLSSWCHVHVSNGSESRAVEILRDSVGMYYARADDTPEGRVTKLNNLKLASLAAGWSAYRGDFRSPEGVTPGTAAVLQPPYAPGLFYFDKETLGARMLGGRSTSLDPTKRMLNMNPLHVRLPKGHDPRRAHGVLVYIDPTPRSEARAFMNEAADELGLIIVAPEKIGNAVYAPDRWQGALDAVATVSSRVLVDPRRVYITGISGGGQISTHMCLCFPELFAGAVPIVALGSYENIPIGNGTMWQGTFGKPQRDIFTLAKQRRLCAITGGKDFNQRVVHEGARILTRDGINVRVNDFADMGHDAPTPARFAEALRWVDEPYRTRQTTDLAAADLLLQTTVENTALDGTARRAALTQVTRVAPWSPAAWKAVELLDPTLLPRK